MSKETLVIVDVQKDFCPGCSLAVPNGDEVVPALNKIIDHAKNNSWPIIATRDWHPIQTSHFDKWPPHCVQNTEGAEFHPEFNTEGTEIFSKGMGENEDSYSGFDAINKNGLRLDEFLQENRITTVFTAGLALDYCVKATALDAAKRAYQVFLLLDATKAVNLNSEDGDKAIEEMKKEGVIFTTTDKVIEGSLIDD